MNCSNELSYVSRLAQPITATTSRESENQQDQPPHKKQLHKLVAKYINCEAQLVKYLNAIYEPGFSADDQPNICPSSEYSRLRSLFASIFSIPASSAPVGRSFSQSGFIIKPHKARMNVRQFARNTRVFEM